MRASPRNSPTSFDRNRWAPHVPHAPRESLRLISHAPSDCSHNIPADNVFKSWEQVFARPKFADAVIIATQDRMHKEPAVAAAAAGYHILLEKPMAVNADDCKTIVAAVKAAGVHFAVGHVLRYTPYMQTIIRLLRSGAIGRVVNIAHLEPIGHEHFAHSYVRGNWRNEKEASFMLMAKVCLQLYLVMTGISLPGWFLRFSR